MIFKLCLFQIEYRCSYNLAPTEEEVDDEKKISLEFLIELFWGNVFTRNIISIILNSLKSVR